MIAVVIGCPTDPPEPPSEPIRISIVERVANGEVDLRQLPIRLTFDDPSFYSYLNGGWYPPREIKQPDGSNRSVVWSKGAAAVLEVQIATRSELSFSIWGRQERGSAKLPAVSVKALFNDHPIEGQIEHYGEVWVFRLSIPASSQLLGLNRLVLLPNFWVTASTPKKGLPEAKRALRVDTIVIEGAHSALLLDFAPAVAEGEKIRQRGESVMSHYLVLPESARLIGRFEAGVAGMRGQIVLTTEGSSPKVLFDSEGIAPDASPNEGPGRTGGEFDLDLSVFTGRTVGLSFVVNGDELSARGTWVDPILVGSGLAAVASAHHDAYNLEGRTKPPNLLIVLFDTLRADATEPYGAPTGRTPEIARLGREGTVFRNAFSSGASTRVSVASLLTGLYPPRHRTVRLKDALPNDIAYLPEMLADRGYRTVGVVNNPQVSAGLGFARGFDAFEELFLLDQQQLRAEHADPRDRARWTWENHVEPLIEDAGDQPFFVYLHELDPHFPYEPLPPYDSFEDNGYRGAPLTELATPNNGTQLSQVFRQLRAVNEWKMRLDRASLEGLRERYFGEVAYMDAYLGWILDWLDEKNLRRNTVVVFVSDHGEEFLEHDRWGHGRQLYDPALRVPLIVSLPGERDRSEVIDHPVELVDVAPTLLGIAGSPISDELQGRDLFARSGRGDSVDSQRPAFAYSDWRYVDNEEGPSPASRQASVRVGPMKLIRTRYQTTHGTFDNYELYDVSADPSEDIDLWYSRPVLGHAMSQRLDRQDFADSRRVPTIRDDLDELDQATTNRLRELGYGE